MSSIMDQKYLIISADGHAGAALFAYKEYLPKRWHEEFDSWARTYRSGWRDLDEEGNDQNWNSDRRERELAADGVVAEVLFPNTIPPFAPHGPVHSTNPSSQEYSRRWAGLQAHNRWLADFCSATPGRRAGIAQVLLNNVDDAVDEIRWAKTAGLSGGILIPGVPPDSADVAPLWSSVYEPIWRECEELDLPINHHGGTGLPSFDESPAGRAVLMVELPWYAHRMLWHLIFSGVVERYPRLKIVLTEQGSGWIPNTLKSLDWFYNRLRLAGSPESRVAHDAVKDLPLSPHEYFDRNFFVGASFMRKPESDVRSEIGIDRLMWGADYPHMEGSTPHSTDALRVSFADAETFECEQIFSATASKVYDFDLAYLSTFGIGIDKTAVHQPILPSQWPKDSGCGTFDPYAVVRSW